jgi:hypothetical protein
MKEEQIVQLEINGGIIYPEKYLPNNLGLVGFEVFSSLIKLSQENARYREALEYISKTDTRDPETEDLVIWLNDWRNYTKQIAREALGQALGHIGTNEDK